MTKDITQQARKEAEEKYLFPDDDHPSQDEDYTVTDIVLAEREAYAAALIHERSKPSPTCEPIYGDYGGINGYSCSNCSAPVGPPEFSRYCGNCARKVLWPEGANYQTHPPKPSLMVGFSEEEMKQIAKEYQEEHERSGWNDEVMASRSRAMKILRYANTRSVSIDRIMEVVKEATWINDVDLLRERLMKIASLP